MVYSISTIDESELVRVGSCVTFKIGKASIAINETNCKIVSSGFPDVEAFLEGLKMMYEIDGAVDKVMPSTPLSIKSSSIEEV